MFYFKDKFNGVSMSNTQYVAEDIVWITEEEFNQIVAEHENELKEQELLKAEAATEEDYLAALEVLG